MIAVAFVERPTMPDMKLPEIDPELCCCLGQIIIAWSSTPAVPGRQLRDVRFAPESCRD
jgi:hypothetical protein